MTKSLELKKLLNKHPDRELIFMYPEEGSDEHYTLGYPSNILVDEYVTIAERVWLKDDDQDELHEELTEKIGDDLYEKFPLTDEQIENAERLAKEQFLKLRWTKAIVVYLRP